MYTNSTLASISSIKSATGNSHSADVMTFTVLDDGQDPIAPNNVMTLHLNGLSQETVTFTLRDQLTLPEGAQVSGFSTNSTGVIPSANAIYSGKGTTNTITLTSPSAGAWTSATLVSYSPATGNAQFATLLQPMLAIDSHVVVQATDVVLTYTSSGTFVVPAGVTEIQVEAWGPGGSGGEYSVGYSPQGTSGGGGGGAYSRSLLTVTPGASIPYVIGLGDPARPPVGCCAFGNPPQFTTFGGSLVTAQGGNSGLPSAWYGVYGSTDANPPWTHGGSGAAGIGDVRIDGGQGGYGENIVPLGSGGGGGSSAGPSSLGGNGTIGISCLSGCSSPGGSAAGGGSGGDGFQTGNGNPGIAPGGGGGGVGLGYTSGAGADGQIRITYSLPVGGGNSDWAADNSPTKFSQLVIGQGTGNDATYLGNWQNVIGGAQLYNGADTVAGTINATNITFAAIPSTTSADLGYVTDANGAPSSKTYTLRIWLLNNLGNTIAANIDNRNLAFKVDPTQFTYDDVTNSNQKSSRFVATQPILQSGVEPVIVTASQLAYHTPGSAPTNTNPQATIGVGTAFSASNAQAPQVYALDANNNLDLNYNYTPTITNPLQGFGQSTSTGLTFASGMLALNPFFFTTGFPTTLNTQIVVTGPGSPAPTTTPATSTNVWPVISSLTTITAGAAGAGTIPSLTTALSGAIAPQTNAVVNFNFIVTDDAGASTTTYANNDALPTQFSSVVIKQGAGNDAVLVDWTKAIAGADLSLTSRNGTATSQSVTTAANVVIGPTSITFNAIPFTAGNPGNIVDGQYNIYTLKIYLKNPVDPTIQDLIDNKSFVFSFDNTGATLGGGANATSEMAVSSTTSGGGNNKVTVAATEVDFIATTEWASGATQYYDASIVPSATAKARDLNQNLDLDWNVANSKSGTVATAIPGTYPLANTTVTLTNGVFTFDPTLRVTSAGGGIDGASTNLVLSSLGLTSGNSLPMTLHYSFNSDIIKDATFVHGAPGPNTYTQNILYANYQAASFSSSTSPSTVGVALERFQVRDGGASHSDADGTATKVSSVTLTFTNGQYLRTVALYNGTTEIGEAAVPTVGFTGDLTINASLSAFSTPVNGDGFLTVYATFIGNGVVDNQVIQVKVKSITSPAASSQFNTPTGTSTNYAALGTNDNQIEVVADRLDFTSPPLAGGSASLNAPFTNVYIRAEDVNKNLDVDYSGSNTVSSFTNNGAPTVTMANGPVNGTTAFNAGIIDFSVSFTNFQFTSGNNGETFTLTMTSTGGLTGTSSTITLKVSLESSIQLDPTFQPVLTPLPGDTYNRISYINYQDSATFGTSTRGYELVRSLLVDGSRNLYTYHNQASQSGILSTSSDADGNGNGDLDSAPTNLTKVSVRIFGASSLSRIGLYDSTGTLIPSTLINVTALGLNRSPVAGVDTISHVFTWTGNLLTAKDDGQAPFSVRVTFRKQSSHIRDTDVIQIKLLDATVGAGSQFFDSAPPVAGYIGGSLHSPNNPNPLGQVDVVATSLDFTTQPSSYAGVNEPVGTDPVTTHQPYSYGNPATLNLMPTTTPGIVTARDAFALTDLEIHPTSIVLKDASGNILTQPAGLGFTNGVMNLNGMSYPAAVGSNGAVSVITTAPSLNSSVSSSGNSIVGQTVNVLDVSVTQDFTGVVPGNGSPATASLKGGLATQNLFGVKFTANAAVGAEPKLRGFTIGFKGSSGSPQAYETNGTFIFENFNVIMNGSNITSVGGVVTKVSSTNTVGIYDEIFVDLSAQPQSLSSGPLSFFLIADVDASANTGTASLAPFFKDDGYGFPTDENSIVSNGTASGAFDGNLYSFASTKPPILKANKTIYPGTKTRPYAGQPNVDPGITQITLEFDTNVGSLDGGGPGNAELWNRTTNKKVADLVLNTTTPVVPVASPTTPQQQASVSAQNTLSNVYGTLLFDIVFPPSAPGPLKADSIYFVKIIKGSYDPNTIPPSGHGIADYGENFYGGISDNSTLYFKVSSAVPINLWAVSSPFSTTTVGTLTTNFDQLGTAHYLIVKQNDPAPTSSAEVINSSTYLTNHPTATLGAAGSYQITDVGPAPNPSQTATFAANFVAGQSYDVYIFAKNDAVPTPVPALGIYAPVGSPPPGTPGFAPQLSGPFVPTLTIPGPVAVQTSTTPNDVPPNKSLLYKLCPGSYVTITNPMVIGETASTSFSFAGDQDFNVLLPTGYEFDVSVSPNVQLFGGNFQNLIALKYGNTGSHPMWEYKYVSNTVLNIRFNNLNNPTNTPDYIAISGVSIIGLNGSAQGYIQWFYGKNVFTAGGTPTFNIAQVALLGTQSPDFNNTYWAENQPFPAPNNASVIAAFNKTVNTIPDNYIDPNNPGAIRLLPITSSFSSGDFLASIFSGTGVTGDLLTLNATTTGAAFNITMTHTDLNGCATTRNEQYLVYDHNSAISKKLGQTMNASIDVTTQKTAAPGSKQDLVNRNFPRTAPHMNPTSPQLGPDELAGYTLLQLSVDLPVTSIALNPNIPMSGPAWRALVQDSIINAAAAPTYTWDYTQVLNALTATTGLANVYDYFKMNGTTIPLSTSGNNYWAGGSLGTILYSGAYQSTADHTVYVPFRQSVELFVPAIPLIEVVSPLPTYDPADAAAATAPTFNTVQYPLANGGYPGTATFCEFGGTITLSGLPSATGGKSVGAFAMYDYQSYKAHGTLRGGTITVSDTSSTIVGVGTQFTQDAKIVVGSLIYDGSGNPIGKVLKITDDTHLKVQSFGLVTSSGYSGNYSAVSPLVPAVPNQGHFIDNGNGTMTLDPTDAGLQNGYSDAIITYTYEDNNSPAVGTGYLIIRITPNPVAKFTIASTIASPGASNFAAFCVGSQITFDGSISTLAVSSQGAVNSINTYSWNFGDANSGTANTVTGGAATASVPTHIYNVSNTYPVSLSLVSQWGCPSLTTPVPTPTVQTSTSNVLYSGTASTPVTAGSTSGNIIVGDNPTPVFSFLGNCVGDVISFTDATPTPGANSTVSSFNWHFGDGATGSGKTVTHTYASPNTYPVTLTPITTLGCQRDSIKYVGQLPVVVPSQTSAFTEFFDASNGGWIALDIDPKNPAPSPGSLGGSSWKWDATIGKWTIPSGYLTNEKSALYSACLDLSSIPRPVISLHANINLATGEGVVLQYSRDTFNIEDPAKGWKVLGSLSNGTSPGLGWYNESAIPSVPGTGYTNSVNSSAVGWAESTGRILPKHKLEDVGANSRVILRFAFASSQRGGGLGLTLDSVRVGSRTRTILFENFTSTNAGPNSSLNGDLLHEANFIGAFTATNIASTQLVNVNYHVGFLGIDPFNVANPSDPSSRALYYNVKTVPYAFLDGKHSQFGGSDLFENWGQGAYDLQTLNLAQANFQDPAQPTTVVSSSTDGSLTVNVFVTPQEDLPASTILQIALLEESVPISAVKISEVTDGENQFNYVLRSFMPNAAGTRFPAGTLKQGVSASLGTFKWTPAPPFATGDTYSVVVFLQDEVTKEVYQSDLFPNITPPSSPTVTAIEPIGPDDIRVYPNPADQEFTIELPSPAQQSMKVTVANQVGQFTELGAINEGEQSRKVSTQGLAEGVYILQLGSNGNALRTKVVVLHK
jgi:hypothetical protein